MDSNSHNTISRFDRFMFFILRMKPLPLKSKDLKTHGIGVVFRLYYKSLKRHKIPLLLAFVAVVGSSFASVLAPLVFKQFLDSLGSQVSTDHVQLLMHLVAKLFAIYFIAWLFWRTAYVVIAYVASRMLAELRQSAFNYLLEHSHGFFVNTFSGSLVQKVNRFANSFDKLEDRFFFDIIPILAQVTFIITVLLNERPMFALVVLIWFPLFLAWNYYLARWKLKYDTSRAAQDSLASAQLADSLSNHQTIELYRSQAVERERYSAVTNLQSLYARFSWQASGVFIDGIQALFLVLVQVTILYIGVHLWSLGLVTVGLFVLVQTYVLQLADKLQSFSRVIRDVYEAVADAQEMADIMTLPHAIQEKENAKNLVDVKGEVSFDNVIFSFNKRNVIDSLSLTIRPGEKVALVGVSGAGKSTLIKLLFRQYDVDSGAVCIDGNDIKELSLISLRKALSLVPQDPALFHRTLMENIRYGRADATDAEVKEAARLAHCDEFIEKLPLGYETLVGEKGVKLSGGERQRVAIARAFLRNSPILVLDEATSSLDSHSEERISDSLMKLMENKTTIIIAHRLSTIRRMDRIIVLADGGVLEDGTHNTLLAKGGVYAKLWDIQQGGFIKDDEEPANDDDK